MTNKIVTNEQIAITSQPASLIMLQSAIEKGMSPEQLLQYYEIHEKFEAKEAKKQFVSSMAKFRAECPIINRTKQGHNSKYAGLAESIEKVKGLMSYCGLSHSWRTNQKDSEIYVTCVLTHIGGHSESTTLSAPKDESGKKSTIQAIASTVAYLERYTFYAITGMTSAEMDDDGAYELKSKAESMQKSIINLQPSISVICNGIDSMELDKAVEAKMELTNEEIASINISPTKAREIGIEPPFTTEQISVMKSEKWSTEVRKYYADKNS